jgi:hypothetical protein
MRVHTDGPPCPICKQPSQVHVFVNADPHKQLYDYKYVCANKVCPKDSWRQDPKVSKKLTKLRSKNRQLKRELRRQRKSAA